MLKTILLVAAGASLAATVANKVAPAEVVVVNGQPTVKTYGTIAAVGAGGVVAGLLAFYGRRSCRR